MSDITMCAGWYHAECKDCYRRLAKPAEMWQSYLKPPEKSPCKYYLDPDDWSITHVSTTVRSRSKQQS